MSSAEPIRDFLLALAVVLFAAQVQLEFEKCLAVASETAWNLGLAVGVAEELILDRWKMQDCSTLGSRAGKCLCRHSVML